MFNCSSSIVRPSVRSYFNNIFRQLLLLNDLAKFVDTSQGCYLNKAKPKLFNKLNSIKISTLIVQIRHLGGKGPRQKACRFYIDLYREILKHPLVETHNVLIFVVYHHMLIHCKDSLNYAPGIKRGPPGAILV